MSNPKWLNDIASFLPISTHFVLSGNVRDIYPVGNELEPLDKAIWSQVRKQGVEALLLWRPFEGVRLVLSTMHQQDKLDQRETAARSDCGLGPLSQTLDPAHDLHGELLQVLRAWGRAESPLSRMGLIVDCIGEFANQTDTHRFVMGELLERQATSRSRNCMAPIFWVVPNANDVPHWFVSASPRVRQIVLPLPDRSARENIARQLFVQPGLAPGLAQRGFADQNLFAEALAEVSHNQQALALRAIASIAAREDSNRGSGDVQLMLRAAATRFRLGDLETSPWELDSLRDKIAAAPIELAKAVIGQPDAVEKVSEILYRSFAGLSGAHLASSGSRPRGVLFFAGPTGVGKTEMAKTIARIIFGDQDHYLRFDMSEFSESHSVARLIGAPPGYVGFNDGGELVNAIRENPFRVILFDEIEKADSAILDKFLQILEDGRLTDGRGQTVYFSDSLIIFTSNLGINRKSQRDGEIITEQLVKFGDPPDHVSETILAGVQSFFRTTINRPELLNRIGKNICVFQFINDADREEIANKFLNQIKRRMLEKGVRLHIDEAAVRQIYVACANPEVLKDGGRGIGSTVEQLVVNKLSRFVFENAASASETLTITRVLDADGKSAFEATYG